MKDAIGKQHHHKCRLRIPIRKSSRIRSEINLLKAFQQWELHLTKEDFSCPSRTPEEKTSTKYLMTLDWKSLVPCDCLWKKNRIPNNLLILLKIHSNWSRTRTVRFRFSFQAKSVISLFSIIVSSNEVRNLYCRPDILTEKKVQ